MKKKYKKKRKKDLNPPLSKRDRFLYRAFGIGVPLLLFLSIMAPSLYHDRMTLSDSEVLAYSVGWNYLLYVLGVMILAIWAAIFSENRLSNRIPIAPPKKEELSPRKQELLRTKRIASVCGLMFCLSLCLFGFFGHTVLRDDLSLVRYNFLNLPSSESSAADLTGLTISINRIGSRRYSLDYHYHLTIAPTYSNGNAATFSDFRLTGEAKLRRLLEIKARFPDSAITLEGQNRIWDLIYDQDYSDAERALAFELFDLTPP